MHELPLVFFTLFAQMAAGLTLIIAPLPDASITQPNLVIDTHNAYLEAQILNPEEV